RRLGVPGGQGLQDPRGVRVRQGLGMSAVSPRENLSQDFAKDMDPGTAALYEAGLRARPSSTEVDALLANHRLAHGEPEQVAYAAQPDPCDLRLPPPPCPVEFERLVEKFGRAGATLLRDYLEEHHRWTVSS